MRPTAVFRRTRAFTLPLAILVLTLAGCNGSSPTEPTGAGTSALTIVFEDPGNQLDGKAEVIRRELNTAFAMAQPRISIDGLVARVNPELGRVIPGWGIGGFSHGPFEVEIAVDPSLPDAVVVERLPWIATHEFHHSARFRGPGYGATLLEAMVSEGLADHFSFELHGPPEAPWAVALGPAQLARWIERARPEFDSTSYDFRAWFFGIGGRMPVWTGYAIGYHLVAEYKAAHRGATAAALVNTSAEVFRPD